MELSKRLLEIARYVKKGANVADIGTDHAYLPIYLVLNKIAKHVIAMDINKGPLESATQNIKSHQLDGIIETRLSDGLNKLKNEDAINTVIIAGMGGHLVKNIITEGIDQLTNIQQLILQPQSDYDVVRRGIHVSGYKIVDEKILEDANKVYFIFLCEKGYESYEQDIYYKYGKILLQKKDPLLLSYMNRLVNQKKKVIKHLEAQSSDESKLRLKELQMETKELEEAME
ncbi:tRNA (adenine(22)-N(1))-methyltransferase [Vallitalea okinawensis]|uniref:tRNA (adenine(22)-N(1))-methyltransferase n=1 Tax=Vallitalea okinawensis TaxID=2078660 RepID=UPI000CFC1147|nr:class I SAM-dependent methyltransferase [Vallitalea okinawensis]